MTRVALVTGAGRGLGAAVALELARRGYALMLTDLETADPAVPYATSGREQLAASCEAARAAGAEARCATADVRDQGALSAVVAEAVQRFGGLDVCVAAAGVIAGGPPLWECDDPTWRLLIDVDLTGVFHTVRAAVPALLARPEPRSGRFVAVSSAAGTRPLRQLAAYSAAKHGVVGLVRSLAADLAGTGVTATVVTPGSMRTPMLEASANIYGLAGSEDFARHALVGRLLEPPEVARTVAHLCATEAGGQTGAVVSVDGGFTG